MTINQLKKNVPEQILVVEDDQATQEAMALKLRKTGLVADFANDGIEGLQKLRDKGPFSLILLDIRLPKGDGFVLMEEKNKDTLLQKIPVIVVSNFSQPEFINRALKLGAKGYLIKAQHSLKEIIEQIIIFRATGKCLIDL